MAQQRTNWVIEVNEKLENIDKSMEEERWKKRSIYKIPACVTDLNKNAYRPQAVSFGPYHHGEAHLKPMEEHKQRALLHFLKRANKPLQVFVDSLTQVVQVLKDCYDPLDIIWQEDTCGFVQLMIMDGCFMLEILRVATRTVEDYAPNDPIFSDHGKLYIMPYVKRDMLMLENQLPMILLDKLLAVECGEEKDEEFVNRLILKFCFPDVPVSSLGKCLHALDVYRKSLLQRHIGMNDKRRSRSRSRRRNGGDNIIRSATELNEAGIRFKKSKTRSLKDISFRGGVLRLPVIVVDDATESSFLNLIAFERFHVGAGNEITSFIFFMDNIIDSERDVALLHSRGIIQNAIGSDKAVAKLFNSMSKDITLDPNSSLDFVHKKVNAYCKKAWNEWRANLIHTYFRNPWAIVSFLAAVLLFALTIVQTVYTIYPIYTSNNDSTQIFPPKPSPLLPSPPLPSPEPPSPHPHG
ncbi:hypothetical protein JCGZ_23062 [Jatropha curcas]|uniref:Uncharacterized protein n=1 Tax=Jatropha curcas TaxID=180498 RepID=A0A067JUP9_JATCU|nr:hypothetical protein JCGZ_23062 [Jatropha curcas]